MRLIISHITDVYHNLALEDLLLHNSRENILMIWQSHGAVVCGKHQNLCAEVNYGFCRENGIAMARRLSGGGTVYHDEGNVNFTFIRQLEEGMERAVNFRQFLDPVIAVLGEMGVTATYSGRNDLLVSGKKISGNAEHIYHREKRVLHHGTLLFDSRLGHLRDALHSTGTYADKAVKSVRSEVTNLKNHLPHIPDTHAFIQALCAGFEKRYAGVFHEISIEETAAAAELRAEKYASEKWILGYSPRYTVCKQLDQLTLFYQVEDGMVSDLRINDTPVNHTPFKIWESHHFSDLLMAYAPSFNIGELNSIY